MRKLKQQSGKEKKSGISLKEKDKANDSGTSSSGGGESPASGGSEEYCMRSSQMRIERG